MFLPKDTLQLYQWLKKPSRLFQYRFACGTYIAFTGSFTGQISLRWKFHQNQHSITPALSHTECQNKMCEREGITEHSIFIGRYLEKVFFKKRKEKQKLLENALQLPPKQLDFSVPKASQAEWCLSCFPISCSSVTSGVEYKWFPLSVQCMPRGPQRP